MTRLSARQHRFVNQFAARAIHQPGAALHLRERRRVEHFSVVGLSGVCSEITSARSKSFSGTSSTSIRAPPRASSMDRERELSSRGRARAGRLPAHRPSPTRPSVFRAAPFPPHSIFPTALRASKRSTAACSAPSPASARTCVPPRSPHFRPACSSPGCRDASPPPRQCCRRRLPRAHHAQLRRVLQQLRRYLRRAAHDSPSAVASSLSESARRRRHHVPPRLAQQRKPALANLVGHNNLHLR